MGLCTTPSLEGFVPGPGSSPRLGNRVVSDDINSRSHQSFYTALVESFLSSEEGGEQTSWQLKTEMRLQLKVLIKTIFTVLKGYFTIWIWNSRVFIAGDNGKLFFLTLKWLNNSILYFLLLETWTTVYCKNYKCGLFFSWQLKRT